LRTLAALSLLSGHPSEHPVLEDCFVEWNTLGEWCWRRGRLHGRGSCLQTFLQIFLSDDQEWLQVQELSLDERVSEDDDDENENEEGWHEEMD